MTLDVARTQNNNKQEVNTLMLRSQIMLPPYGSAVYGLYIAYLQFGWAAVEMLAMVRKSDKLQRHPMAAI